METELRDTVFSYIESLDILPIYYPNISQLANQSVSHLRINIMPITPIKIGLCGNGAWHEWIVQLSIHVSGGAGELVATRHADSIRDAFIFGSMIGRFKLISIAAVLPPLTSDGWYVLPVQIKLSNL